MGGVIVPGERGLNLVVERYDNRGRTVERCKLTLLRMWWPEDTGGHLFIANEPETVLKSYRIDPEGWRRLADYFGAGR